MGDDQIIEPEADLAELVDARLSELVDGKFSQLIEAKLLSYMKRLITEAGLGISVNVPQGEPPTVQFSMPPIENRISVKPADIIISPAPGSTEVLSSIASSLHTIMLYLNEMRAAKRVTIERDIQGFIKTCTIDRVKNPYAAQ